MRLDFRLAIECRLPGEDESLAQLGEGKSVGEFECSL
jgi:hypothetical protein